MPRKGAVPKRKYCPIPYNSRKATKLINQVMLDKGIAEKAVYGACVAKNRQRAIEAFGVMKNVMPVLEVSSPSRELTTSTGRS